MLEQKKGWSDGKKICFLRGWKCLEIIGHQDKGGHIFSVSRGRELAIEGKV